MYIYIYKYIHIYMHICIDLFIHKYKIGVSNREIQRIWVSGHTRRRSYGRNG